MENQNQNQNQNRNQGTSERGFASMDEDKQREIARKGGEASHSGSRSSSQNNPSQSRSPEQQQ